MSESTAGGFDVLEFLVANRARLRRNLAFVRGHSGSEPDDVMQEACLRLFTERRKIRDTEHANKLFFTIAANLSKDQKRRAKSRRTDPVGNFHEAAAGVADDPADTVADSDTLNSIIAAVREALTDTQFRAWVAVDVEGRSYDEAAAALGWTRSQLSSALERARKELRGRPHLFEAIVCSVVLLPRRLWAWARPESSSMVAVGTVATFTMLAATPGVLAPTARADTPPPTVRVVAVPRPRSAVGPTGVAPLAPPPAPPHRPSKSAEAATAPRALTLLRRPLTGTRCLPGRTVCVGDDDDSTQRFGHSVWVANPITGRPHHIWQDRIPVCDVVDPVPDQPLVGCDRYGPINDDSLVSPPPIPSGQ